MLYYSILSFTHLTMEIVCFKLAELKENYDNAHRAPLIADRDNPRLVKTMQETAEECTQLIFKRNPSFVS